MDRNETGEQWLTELLSLMGYPTSVRSELQAQHDTTEASAPNYWLEIDHSDLRPHQVQALIGIDGSNLDAMQYLANTLLNLQVVPGFPQCFYTIELNGYRAERLSELQELAEKAAAIVRETQQDYTIKSLSAADRRYVHMYLKDLADIETESQGREPHRHLIVRLARDS